MRILLPAAAMLALGACQSEVGGTRSGVGFGSYELYQQQQDYMARAGLVQQSTDTEMAAMGNTAETPMPQSAVAPAIEVASAGPTPVTTGPLSATAVYDAPVPAAAPSTNNIAAFALSTSHAVGQPLYRRVGARLRNSDRACADFASDSLAQEAFLEAGGPDRDRLGVDPDGDGYACGWDPAAFRLARQ